MSEQYNDKAASDLLLQLNSILNSDKSESNDMSTFNRSASLNQYLEIARRNMRHQNQAKEPEPPCGLRPIMDLEKDCSKNNYSAQHSEAKLVGTMFSDETLELLEEIEESWLHLIGDTPLDRMIRGSKVRLAAVKKQAKLFNMMIHLLHSMRTIITDTTDDMATDRVCSLSADVGSDEDMASLNIDRGTRRHRQEKHITIATNNDLTDLKLNEKHKDSNTDIIIYTKENTKSTAAIYDKGGGGAAKLIQDNDIINDNNDLCNTADSIDIESILRLNGNKRNSIHEDVDLSDDRIPLMGDEESSSDMFFERNQGSESGFEEVKNNRKSLSQYNLLNIGHCSVIMGVLAQSKFRRANIYDPAIIFENTDTNEYSAESTFDYIRNNYTSQPTSNLEGFSADINIDIPVSNVVIQEHRLLGDIESYEQDNVNRPSTSEYSQFYSDGGMLSSARHKINTRDNIDRKIQSLDIDTPSHDDTASDSISAMRASRHSIPTILYCEDGSTFNDIESESFTSRSMEAEDEMFKLNVYDMKESIGDLHKRNENIDNPCLSQRSIGVGLLSPHNIKVRELTTTPYSLARLNAVKLNRSANASNTPCLESKDGSNRSYLKTRQDRLIKEFVDSDCTTLII